MSALGFSMTIFALGSLAALVGLLADSQDDDFPRPAMFLCWVVANLVILGVAALGYCAYLVVTGRLA
jgi:hypothetical protein